MSAFSGCGFSSCVCRATPPVRLGLSGRNSGKIPERPRKRSQSVSWNFPREYGWDTPNPIIQGISGFQSVSRILSPPVRLGTPLFSELVPERALRARHEIPSSTGGISVSVNLKGVFGSAPCLFPPLLPSHTASLRLYLPSERPWRNQCAGRSGRKAGKSAREEPERSLVYHCERLDQWYNQSPTSRAPNPSAKQPKIGFPKNLLRLFLGDNLQRLK